MLGQYLKHLVVHTPIESVAVYMQRALTIPQRMFYPELTSIHEEPHYIDAACRMLLRPESNVIDIGAHLGSQLGAFISVARFGRHIAIEPVPYKARWLRRKFPHVEVHELALHETAGQCTFFVNTSRPGYSGLRAHRSERDVISEITVAQKRLDEVVPEDQDIDLIKIDVEGAELFVLRGAQRLLERCRPNLLFESTQTGLATWDLAPDALYEFLQHNNYRIYLPRAFVSGGAALSQDEFAVSHEYPFRGLNFLAIPLERPLGRRRSTARARESTVQLREASQTVELEHQRRARSG